MKSLRRSQPSSLPSLPSDIIHDIFSQLPVKPLARFRCVCKSWYDLLTNPSFLKIQCNHRHSRVITTSWSCSGLQSIDIETEARDRVLVNHKSPSKRPVSFVGSCDGLLCVLDADQYLLLWNPCTGQYKRLPDSAYFEDDIDFMFYGFGFDKSIDDYKVVKGEFRENSEIQDCKVEVYTRKTNSWKSIEDSFHNKFPCTSTTGIFVDGFLHWLAIQHNDINDLIIASFDLAKEKFGELALPDCEDVKDYVPAVGFLKGMLCLYCQENNDSYMWTIWAMKEYGVTESWTILMKIPFDQVHISSLGPFCLTKIGELVMQVTWNEMCDYNPREKKFKKLLDLKLLSTSATYVESLVSPNIDK